MFRRHYLAGVFAAATSAGCLTAGDDTMQYETHQLRHDEPVIEGGVPLPDAPPPEERTAHLVTTADGTARFDRAVLDEEAAAFVDGTDFSEAYLLVVGTYLGSTSGTVEITSVEQADGEATARVEVRYPTAGDTAIAYETELVRVHLEGESAPERAEVTFDFGDEEEIVTVGG